MEKIFIKTFGCSLNQADSEAMAGILKKKGFEIVGSPDEANLVIINSCTVKGPTEIKFFRYLKSIKKPVVIAGCIAQTDPEKLEGYSLIGTSQIGNIVEVVEETLNGHQVALIVSEKNKRLGLPKIRRRRSIEVIPISSGCLGDPCAYCKVKSARGELVSYPKEEIIEEVKRAVRHNAKEIWLTAQDTGCYGKDIGTTLPDLLKEVLAVEGEFYVRLGMANPNHVIEMIPQLIECYKHPKMFKFLHIPVQSGNDEILKSMRRKYTVEDFKKIVTEFRKEIPKITIATDMICGFPGESERQFKDSMELIKEIKPDVLNVSRFWPRPKTEAAKLPGKLASWQTKERSRQMVSIFEWISFERNKLWERWEGHILIDESGKTENGTVSWIGRNIYYKPVVVFTEDNLIGQKIKVKIRAVTRHDLRADILS